MPSKAYISNILKVWHPEEQQKLLDATGERPTVYRDDLRPGERKRKSVEALAQRAAVLRPTGRKSRDEVLYVACLGLLAWDLRDLQGCFRAAKARGATVVALNTGRRIAPDAGVVEIDEAQADFTADKRRGAVQPGRVGYEIAAEQKDEDTKRRIELIRADWGNPKFSQEELLARAGRRTKRGAFQPMAWKTARKYLPNRQWLLKQKAGIARAKENRK